MHAAQGDTLVESMERVACHEDEDRKRESVGAVVLLSAHLHCGVQSLMLCGVALTAVRY